VLRSANSMNDIGTKSLKVPNLKEAWIVSWTVEENSRRQNISIEIEKRPFCSPFSCQCRPLQ
jgi:hypothetical protein